MKIFLCFLVLFILKEMNEKEMMMIFKKRRFINYSQKIKGEERELYAKN